MLLLRRARRWLAYLICPECREIGRTNQVLVGRVNELEGVVGEALWLLIPVRVDHVSLAREVLRGVLR